MLMLKNKILLRVLLLGIFIFLLFWGKLQLQQVNDNFANVNIKNAKCNIKENTCLVENELFKLKLNMDKNIRYLTPFNVTASSIVKAKHPIARIQLDFKMKGMDMGVNRILLKPGKQENNIQQWHGNGLLPICVSGRADWVAELELYINQTRYRLQFPVTVLKSSK